MLWLNRLIKISKYKKLVRIKLKVVHKISTFDSFLKLVVLQVFKKSSTFFKVPRNFCNKAVITAKRINTNYLILVLVWLDICFYVYVAKKILVKTATN